MIEPLCIKMENMSIKQDKVSFEENRVLYILNSMKKLSKTPKHVRENLEKDKMILQQRIKREHRMLSKLKNVKMISSAPEHAETKENKEEEPYTEVYEESYMENQEDHPFDIDNFNDE